MLLTLLWTELTTRGQAEWRWFRSRCCLLLAVSFCWRQVRSSSPCFQLVSTGLHACVLLPVGLTPGRTRRTIKICATKESGGIPARTRTLHLASASQNAAQLSQAALGASVNTSITSVTRALHSRSGSVSRSCRLAWMFLSEFGDSGFLRLFGCSSVSTGTAAPFGLPDLGH